ncbi:hypothetical protein GCM10020331_067820 [Ectobacillus funiculus]
MLHIYQGGGRVTGLSKLARTVDTVARRPQLQERITSTVADAILDVLDPHGVMVVLEAEHMCMTMRGVKKPGGENGDVSGSRCTSNRRCSKS